MITTNSEELQRVGDAIAMVWSKLEIAIQELANAIKQVCNDIWSFIHSPKEKPRSPKHPYHVPTKQRHIKSQLVSTYNFYPKVPRDLPYQRRNY